MKRNMKRRGFTLVELLIVIVVIGILSAMMMLSSTEAVTSAKASNIVSNLRNLKTAALAFYVDHLDMMEGVTNVAANAKGINGKTTGEGTTATTTYEEANKFTIPGSGATAENVTFTKAVAHYMNNAENSATDLETLGYGVLIDANGDWFVTYDITKEGSSTEQTQIKQKLAGRAKSVGLCKGGTAPAKANPFTTSDTNVAMFVR